MDDEISDSEQTPLAKKAQALVQGWRRRKRLTLDDKSLEDQPMSNPEKLLIEKCHTEESTLPKVSLSLNDGGREGDKESDGSMKGFTTYDAASRESEWEVSNFMSSEDSCDEW